MFAQELPQKQVYDIFKYEWHSGLKSELNIKY